MTQTAELLELTMAFIAPSLPLLRPPPQSSFLRPSRRHVLPAALPRQILRAPPKAELLTGLGRSTNPSTAAATLEALETALQTAPLPSLAVVLATSAYDIPELHATLADRLPTTPLHGATSCAAVLSNNGPFSGLTILLLQAAATFDVAAACLDDTPFACGKAAAERLAARMGSSVTHVLMHATPGIEEGVIAGIASVLGDIPVFGGSAADADGTGKWSVVCSDLGVLSAGVSLVGVGDGVKVGSCLYPPYVPTDVYATVTAAEGRVVNTLDGRPAGEVLAEWAGGEVASTVASGGGSVLVPMAGFPLGVARGDGYATLHAEAILPEGGVSLFAEVKKGEQIRVMSRVDGLDASGTARLAVQAAYEGAMRDGGLEAPKAGLLVYCGGLGIAVGDSLGHSIEGVAAWPDVAGIMAFGEQGRIGGVGGHCNLAVGVALFE